MSAERLREAAQAPSPGDQLAEHGDIWHRADFENTLLALSGLPWMTLCGIRRPRLRASRPRTLASDTCVACVELSGGGAA